MVGISEVLDYWENRIPQDLIPFADPGSEVLLERSGRKITARWICREDELQADFTITIDQGAQVRFLDRNLSYSSFLVSPEMSDLLGLAKMILQSQKGHFFVATKATLVDSPNRPPASAVDTINETLNSFQAEATKIVMITGEAGAGKTRVLQELVRRQAHAYQQGKVKTLYLYVNAQGRALARLTEAFATELQDLRARLTYHAIATLVRVGALVPVIDGFDELIGVGGYDDAFSSLARFIEELDGQGQIVASARSAYYEEEFVSRSTTVSSLGGQIWTQVPIRVAAWKDEEFEQYVKHSVQSISSTSKIEETVDRIRKVFTGQNVELRQKPLFVSKAVSIILEGGKLTGKDDLLNELIEAYLEREKTEKLLDRNENSLLTIDQIATLLTALSEEMWNQETRELDRRSVREVAEYILVVEEVEESTQKIVIERMPTLAFLAPGDRAGSITFEHELFFSAFLSRVFSREIIRQTPSLRTLLSRSILPPEVADIAIRRITSHQTYPEAETLSTILVNIAEAGGSGGLNSAQVRENGGRIVLAALQWICSKDACPPGIKLKNIIFPGGDLSNVHLSRASFINVDFHRTDLTNTSIIDSFAKDVMLQEVTVNPSKTRLELRGIDPGLHVYGLRVVHENATETIYDPDEIINALAKCGTIEQPSVPVPKRKVSPRHLKLLERFMRAYNRSNPVCISDEHLASLFNDGEWKNLEKLLIEHDIVTPEQRGTGGRPKKFLRRQILPENFMAGMRKDARIPSNVRKFWDAVELL